MDALALGLHSAMPCMPHAVAVAAWCLHIHYGVQSGVSDAGTAVYESMDISLVNQHEEQCIMQAG
jgi:hypothetical protein